MGRTRQRKRFAEPVPVDVFITPTRATYIDVRGSSTATSRPLMYLATAPAPAVNVPLIVNSGSVTRTVQANVEPHQSIGARQEGMKRVPVLLTQTGGVPPSMISLGLLMLSIAPVATASNAISSALTSMTLGAPIWRGSIDSRRWPLPGLWNSFDMLPGAIHGALVERVDLTAVWLQAQPSEPRTPPVKFLGAELSVGVRPSTLKG